MTVEQMQQIKKESGLSYDEIAKGSGVPFGTVQKILSETTKSPRHTTLTALETYFSQVLLSERTLPAPAPSVLAEPRAACNAQPQKGYTLEDYLALPDNERKELIDGTFYDMAAPSTVHQVICSQLYLAFANYINDQGAPCEAFFAPIDIQLDRDDKTIVEPDICVVCDSDIIHRARIVGAPDFIVEITSPSTRKRDMTLKMWKYSNAGVREYWIVDPDRLSIIVYDFENDLKLSSYSFHDIIPVGIYQGNLEIDFEKIWRKIQRFYEE